MWVCRLYGKAKDNATVTTGQFVSLGGSEGNAKLVLRAALVRKDIHSSKTQVCVCTCAHALMCYPTPASIKQGF